MIVAASIILVTFLVVLLLMLIFFLVSPCRKAIRFSKSVKVIAAYTTLMFIALLGYSIVAICVLINDGPINENFVSIRK